MRLRAKILRGLTLASAGHQLPAHDQVPQREGMPPDKDVPPSLIAAGVGEQSSASDTSVFQSSPSQPLPASPQDPEPSGPTRSVPQAEEVGPQPPISRPDHWHWLDWTSVYDALWHSAMRVDRWFGSHDDESEYQKVYGSIAPALLWDRHYGFSEPFRFNVNLPLPQIDKRFHAFLGRFDPNEVITESSQPSGAFRRQYGPATQDETLFGLGLHQPPKQGGYFDTGAGIRVALPLDPYLKGSEACSRRAKPASGNTARGSV